MDMHWEQLAPAVMALLGAGAAAWLWVIRHIMRDEMAPLRQDIEVLRVAVFNHLSHGQEPREGAIRKGMGYGPRS